MKPEVRWPLFIVGLLVSQVVLGLFFLWHATSDPSFAVEEDYYQKAIAWDDRIAQDRTNTELGWRTSVAVQAPEKPGDPAQLSVTLVDRLDQPVSGAEVAVETFHNIRAGDILRGHLKEDEPGAYSTSLPMIRPGVWEVRLTVTRGEEIFTHRERSYVVASR